MTKEHARRKRVGTIGSYLVGLVAIQLVLLLGLIGFAAWQDVRSARRDAAATARSAASLAADYVASQIDEARGTIAQAESFSELLASPAVCSFTNQSEGEGWDDDGFRSTFLLLRYDGTPRCPVPEGETFESAAGAAWFQEAVSTGRPVELPPATDPFTGAQSMLQAIAFEQFDIVMAIITDLSSISESLAQQFETSDPMPAFVVTSADGATEYSDPEGNSGRSLTDTPFVGAEAGETATFADLAGTERIFAMQAIPEDGWQVFAGISTDDAIAPVRRAFRERMLFAGLTILVVFAVALVLQRRFVRPVRSLARVTTRASEGDLNATVHPSGPVELRELGESFNEMLKVRKQAESALKKAYRAERRAAEDLREVADMRNAFLMAISHELRTPLTSVVGYSSFLDDAIDDLPPEEIRKSIKAITAQSKRLERLLLDLLDVERLERGIVEPNVMETDVRQLVMRVIESAPNGRKIRADIKRAVRADVDPALVERMLENLVFNAVKHTPDDAKIWVRASRHNGTVRLAVEDSGSGVPDEIKTAIFEPFQQGDVPSHSPGTGVGLNLVAQFAKLHGGRAWVEDRRGGGASFRVELPAKNGHLKKAS